MGPGTRLRVSVTAAALLAIAPAALAADYKPVRCDSALTYEGAPLYAGRVPLSPPEGVPGSAVDSALADRLYRACADAMQRTRAPFMTAAVATSQGIWSTTRNAAGDTVAQSLWWASAGKLFTAIVVMQLVDEGRLSLEDPIVRWFSDFPNARAITVDHLLQHTAGIFSANEDLVVRRKPRYRTPEETIAIAAKHGPMFCPGHRWRYSNTGYSMLGRIVEAVEQRPYHEIVNERIVKRLGLRTLRALAPREEPDDVAPLTPTGTEPVMMKPNWAYAAGSVVGSARDMVAVWHGLLAGNLLSPARVGSMFEKLYPMFDPGTFYGRGVMLYEFTDAGSKGTWLGHSGGSPGAKAVVLYSPADQAFVAVALTGDGSAEASANLLLQQLRAPAAGEP